MFLSISYVSSIDCLVFQDWANQYNGDILIEHNQYIGRMLFVLVKYFGKNQISEILSKYMPLLHLGVIPLLIHNFL